MEKIDYLNELNRLARQKQITPYVCIIELIERTLKYKTSNQNDNHPTRTDITEYLTAWFRHVKFLPEEIQSFLVSYAVDVLSAISSSSPGSIRHSTKSIIKYIYRSDFEFKCYAGHNNVRSICSPDCPIYQTQKQLYEEKVAQELREREESEKRIAELTKPDSETQAKLERKRIYQETIDIIFKKREEKVPYTKIAELLNQQKRPSQHGKTWTGPRVQAIYYLKRKKRPSH